MHQSMCVGGGGAHGFDFQQDREEIVKNNSPFLVVSMSETLTHTLQIPTIFNVSEIFKISLQNIHVRIH